MGIGASGIHVGTMSFGKMEGDSSDKNIAYMLQQDEADGPYYHQEWQGMIQTTPIISGGMNALRLPAFFENLTHSNVILTAGGGSFGHKDGPKQGATSCRQAEEGWKEQLGYTGESSVQAATFDWAKKAGSATFVGRDTGARPFYYMKQRQVYYELDWNNDTGYLPDGRALNKVGNQNNHPELQGPDLHTPGAPLPKAKFGNEVGYLPDGTPMNKCGNMNNHPEISAPDPHTPGAPLPPPLFGYINDV